MLVYTLAIIIPMKTLLIVLLLLFLSHAQTDSSSFFLAHYPPTNMPCYPPCRSGYTCAGRKCIKIIQPPNNFCENGYTCQNEYCLPNICAPCPPKVVCIWNMPCPDGFVCKNSKCIKNCYLGGCKAKTCNAWNI